MSDSITIIDNISTKPPILQWRPTPTFRTELENQKYRAEERRRCLEGYNGIPGTLYNKTMHQQIKNRITGEMIHPICRDGDLLIHENLLDCKNTGEALLLEKGRGFGLSCEGGCLTDYHMRMYPGSTSFITSSEFPKIQAIFTENIMPVYESLEADIKPPKINYNKASKNVYLSVEIKHLKEGVEVFSTSQVFLKETADNDHSASGFSGRGALFGFYDEAFLHKRIAMLLRSSSGCYRDPDTKKVSGMLLLGGVVEPTLTNDEIVKYHTFIKDAKANKFAIPIRTLFMPFWMGMFIENGHSNRKKAEQWWNDEYNRVKDNPADLRSHMMQYPRTEDDIFQLTSGEAFEEDVTAMIETQITTIKKNPPHISKTTFVNIGGQVQTTPTTNKNIFLLEEPKDSIRYYQLIDGVATGLEQGTKEGSNFASIIVKGYDPSGGSYAPVNIYYDKPKTVEQGYIIIANQFKYYNKFNGFEKKNGSMPEANIGTADHFSTFMQKEGLGGYLANRKDLSGKGHSNTKKIGQYVTKDVLDFYYRFMNIHLRNHIQDINMIMLLEDLLKPISVNADMRSAFLLLASVLPPDYDKPVKEIPDKKPRQIRTLIRENGITKYRWQDA